MSARTRCPVCKQPAAAPGASPFPFCSDRCRLMDLNNWLDGRYVVTSALPFDEATDALPDDLSIEDLQ